MADLRADVRVAAAEAIADMKGEGVHVIVTCTSRTLHHQIALFAQNRCPLAVVNHLRLMASLLPLTEAENKNTVTNCDGIATRSSHQDGRAIDVVVMRNGKPIWRKDLAPKEYKIVGACFKAHGFAWGGDWPPLDKNGIGWDAGHAEMT